MVWRESLYKGFPSTVGENEEMSVEIVPSRGSKLVSLINKKSQRNWIYQNEVPWEPLQYGMNWGDGDRSGWDEMFPTILPCPCPNTPWQHVVFPDHGEVWALPWEYEIIGNQVKMRVHGVQVPYILEKTYSLNGKQLHIDYKVENPTPFAFSYLWAAHSLLNVDPGTKLITEPQLDSVLFYYSHKERLARINDRVSYPMAETNSEPVDLSVLEHHSEHLAEKYWFEGTMQRGMAGLKTKDGETFTYLFLPEEVPYLAVWANYGAFFGEYNFAFEPATGYFDNVYTAHTLQKVKMVDKYSANRWRLTVSLDSLDQSL